MKSIILLDVKYYKMLQKVHKCQCENVIYVRNDCKLNQQVLHRELYVLPQRHQATQVHKHESIDQSVTEMRQ